MDRTDRQRPVYPILFVLGMSHSGSTLLGRMLNMHSQVLCVGELMRIKGAMEKRRPCSCGNQIAECGFWDKYLRLIEKENGFNYKRFTPEFYHKLKTNSGNQVIVDLSKNRVFRMMKHINASLKWKSDDTGFILILRDPRGLSASMLRRSTKGLANFLARHKKWMQRFQKFTEKQGHRVLILRYEDLCLYPESQLKRICQFLGIDFEDNMLFPANKSHHFIHSSTSGYLRNANQLVIDERWRHELQPEDIRRINTVTNEVNLLKNAYADSFGLQSRG